MNIGVVLQYPFTGLCLFTLFVAAVVSQTMFANLTVGRLKQFGYAPRHFWELKLHKLFISALVTHGPKDFIQAILMIGLFLGTLEHFSGSFNSFLIFISAHVITLVAISIGLKIPVHLSDWDMGKTLLIARDVGPSAGYFGSVGAVICFVNPAYQLFVFIGMLILLLVAFFIPPLAHIEPIVKKHADTAHVIALIYGYSTMLFLNKHSLFS